MRTSFCTILIAFSLLTSLQAQVPNGYYSFAENKSDQALRSALHNIIDDHIEFPYTSSSTDTWDILQESDADPSNSNNVILVYTRESVNGPQEYNGGSGWNREHVWAKSRGDFGTEIGEGTDVHNLRASNVQVNSTRTNYSFDNCTTNSCNQTYGNSYSSTALVFEPRDEDKGDVARIIFYMDIRYEGDSGELDLEMTENILSISSKLPRHGVRSTLLEWHQSDPVDDFERNRNDVIYSYQGNRNPFIDHQNLWITFGATNSNRHGIVHFLILLYKQILNCLSLTRFKPVISIFRQVSMPIQLRFTMSKASKLVISLLKLSESKCL